MITLLLKIKNICKVRAIQITLLLTLFAFFASSIPFFIHQIFYSISVSMKEIMLFFLPLIVGSFIAHTLIGFERRATLFLFAIIIFEAFSNFMSVWYSFFCAQNIQQDIQLDSFHVIENTFTTLWKLPFEKPLFWTADKGTFAGVLIALYTLVSKKTKMIHFIQKWKNLSNWILTRIFSPLIPLFILGFLSRIYNTGLLKEIFTKYSILIVWLSIFIILYILMLIFLASNYNLKSFLQSTKNLLPPAMIAFSSGCSLSTMPWTIEAASKNLKNPSFAQAVIPATTNIQQIGDCIANTFLCFILYKHCFHTSPSLSTWLEFSIIFTLYRFTTAAVLGGAILIMVPVYETYLGFNTEMVAIILALNVILDPIITSANVLANGALCSIFEKMWLYLLKIQKGFKIKYNKPILKP